MFCARCLRRRGGRRLICSRAHHGCKRRPTHGRHCIMRDFGEAPPPPTFFERLKEGLSRSTAGLSDNITGIFTKKNLDAESVAQLEEALIKADMGTALAAKLSQ